MSGRVSERCPGRENCAALNGVCALQCIFHESDRPFTGGDTPPTKCPDCGHDPHEFIGCTGNPTPSDLWAGVPVAACDCSGVTPPAEDRP